MMSGPRAPLMLTLDYYLTMYVYQLTPLHTWSEQSTELHFIVHQYFLLCGLFFWWPIVAADPVRLRLSANAKRVMVWLGLPAFGLLGVIELATGSTATGVSYLVCGAVLTVVGAGVVAIRARGSRALTSTAVPACTSAERGLGERRGRAGRAADGDDGAVDGGTPGMGVGLLGLAGSVLVAWLRPAGSARRGRGLVVCAQLARPCGHRPGLRRHGGAGPSPGWASAAAAGPPAGARCWRSPRCGSCHWRWPRRCSAATCTAIWPRGRSCTSGTTPTTSAPTVLTGLGRRARAGGRVAVLASYDGALRTAVSRADEPDRRDRRLASDRRRAAGAGRWSWSGSSCWRCSCPGWRGRWGPTRARAVADRCQPADGPRLVAAGHNDVLMAGLLVAGVAVALEGRPLSGSAICALAATIKVPALVGAVFIAVAWARADR